MRKPEVLAAIALVTATVALAQTKPDFSGTWTLDASRSEMGAAPGGSGPGGGPGGRMGAIPADAKVVIKQTPAELIIDLQVSGNSQVSTLKLDGSESVNIGPRGGQIKSKARWDGDRLRVDSTQTMNTPNGGMTLETKETRWLAPDGTMVVERTLQTPRGTRTQKLVFAKVS